MAIVAYLRVSTSKQDLDAQRLAVMSYAQKEGFLIDAFQEVTLSSRHNRQRKHLDAFIETLESGDTLVVSELSRVGRSLGVIIQHVNNLLANKINFIAVKEGIRLLNGKQDMQSKMMVAMFGLFAEVERDLISERTKEGIAKAKKAGKKIGRPKGKKSKSKLDGKEELIAHYLDNKVPITAIARLLGCSTTTLRHFIESRNLKAGALLKEILD